MSYLEIYNNLKLLLYSYLIMKIIINNNEKIDERILLDIFKRDKIDYMNKEIYVFVYDFIDILNLLFLNDIKYFLSNKIENDKNILIIYQDIYENNDFVLKYENLYLEILKSIKIKFREIEFILYK